MKYSMIRPRLVNLVAAIGGAILAVLLFKSMAIEASSDLMDTVIAVSLLTALCVWGMIELVFALSAWERKQGSIIDRHYEIMSKQKSQGEVPQPIVYYRPGSNDAVMYDGYRWHYCKMGYSAISEEDE